MSQKKVFSDDNSCPDPSGFDDCCNTLMNAPIGIFTSTPDGKYLSVNPAQAGMLGYDTPEDLLESVTDIARQVYVDPAERDTFTRLLEKHGQIVNQVSRFRRKDGSQLWVSWSARAIRDQDGEVTHYQGFNMDISEYKRAEEVSGEYHKRLITILYNINSLIYVADMETYEILFVNQHGRDNLGDVEGRKCWESMP